MIFIEKDITSGEFKGGVRGVRPPLKLADQNILHAFEP
jgi:hypothetical protein